MGTPGPGRTPPRTSPSPGPLDSSQGSHVAGRAHHRHSIFALSPKTALLAHLPIPRVVNNHAPFPLSGQALDYCPGLPACLAPASTERAARPRFGLPPSARQPSRGQPETGVSGQSAQGAMGCIHHPRLTHTRRTARQLLFPERIQSFHRSVTPLPTQLMLMFCSLAQTLAPSGSHGTVRRPRSPRTRSRSSFVASANTRDWPATGSLPTHAAWSS